MGHEKTKVRHQSTASQSAVSAHLTKHPSYKFRDYYRRYLPHHALPNDKIRLIFNLSRRDPRRKHRNWQKILESFWVSLSYPASPAGSPTLFSARTETSPRSPQSAFPAPDHSHPLGVSQRGSGSSKLDKREKWRGWRIGKALGAMKV